MDILYEIERLLDYSVTNDLMDPRDSDFARNQLLSALRLPEPAKSYTRTEPLPETPVDILENIVGYAVDAGIVKEDTQTQRELFDTLIMGLIAPKPSAIIDNFNSIYRNMGAKAATDMFYSFCRKINYIRTAAVAKNIYFPSSSRYGTLEITINMSKPELTPQEIIAMKNAKGAYPECMLCHENEGFAGRIGRPARQTLRCIPLKLNGEEWYFQYSPYVYYDEHCIVYSKDHTPMKTDRDTAERLFDFIDQFPHYFIGSNSDLPIVGGSILSHNHFQGGKHRFAMQEAGVRYELGMSDTGSQVDIIDWPLSTIRLSGTDRRAITTDAARIIDAWRCYNNPQINIIAESDGEMHNAVTTIASKNGANYELYLVLRNNLTTDEHPLGLYHPHSELHHIKIEGIGLIEVMGLFVLPARLSSELKLITDLLSGNITCAAEYEALNKHAAWIDELITKYGRSNSSADSETIIKNELTKKCEQILEACGVFKKDSGSDDFCAFVRRACGTA